MTPSATADVTDATLPIRVFLPSAPSSSPPLVLVHGSRRRAGAMLHAFLPAAMQVGVPLVVPRFGRPQFEGYQRLAGSEGPRAAEKGLLSSLDGLTESTGIDCTRVDLMGFSGGAQFAHRFALMNPSRVRRLVTAAAGWYTRLDPARSFPRGIKFADDAAVIDLDAFLALPQMVAVGERDTEDDGALRHSPTLDREQGTDRVARALAWLDHLEDEGSRRGIDQELRFELLPGTGHSWSEAVGAGGLVGRALAFLLDEAVR